MFDVCFLTIRAEIILICPSITTVVNYNYCLLSCNCLSNQFLFLVDVIVDMRFECCLAGRSLCKRRSNLSGRAITAAIVRFAATMLDIHSVGVSLLS